MEIKEMVKAHYISLAPQGDLDAHSSVHLDSRIRDLIEAGQVNIHVDFSSVPYISSAGLGVFISFLEDIITLGGKFVLTHMRDSVWEVFSLLGLDNLSHMIIDRRPEPQIEPYFTAP
jgi:anti-sigma B factor antagonist